MSIRPLAERHSGRTAVNGRQSAAAVALECGVMPSLTVRKSVRQNPVVHLLTLKCAGPNSCSVVKG